MQRLNRLIWNFAVAQIAAAAVMTWVYDGGYYHLVHVFDAYRLIASVVQYVPVGHTVQIVLGAAIVLALTAFTTVGLLIWGLAGRLRAAVTGTVLGMGAFMLLGHTARVYGFMPELNYAWVLTQIIMPGAYALFAWHAPTIVLERLAREALPFANVRIDAAATFMLCMIMPATMLGVAYAERVENQIVVLFFGAAVLVLYTAVTNRMRTNAWRAHVAAEQAARLATRRGGAISR